MTIKRNINSIISVFLLGIVFLSLPAHAEVKRVVLFPLVLNGDESKGYLRQGLRDMLKSRLSDPGIDLVSDEAMESILSGEDKNGINSPIKAKELGGLLDADFAIFGSITVIGALYSLDIGIENITEERAEPRWITETAEEDELIKRVENVAARLRSDIEGIDKQDILKAEVSTVGSPEEVESKEGLLLRPSDEYHLLEPAGSYQVRMEVMASATGDLNSDGRTELVILGRKKIMLYSKMDKYFTLKDTLKPSFGYDFLKISIGDADGNGMDEICVVSLNGRMAESTVWEWAGKFEKLYKLKGHLRIVKTWDSEKPAVLFQESKGSKDSFFQGEIWVMGFDNKGKPIKKKPLHLPNNPQFYTVSFFDLNNDEKEEILYLGTHNASEFSYMYLCSLDGQLLWQSSETFGGTNNIIKIDFFDEYNTEPPRIPLNCSPVLMDSDGDGQDEILVVKNFPRIGLLANTKTFIKSQITVFKAQGMGLNIAWRTGVNEYNVVDMHVDEGILFLATHKPRMTNFNKESGKIIWFR